MTTTTRTRSLLLAWYDAHARDLPWRRTRDPYAIWVSEIMLQQTRVDTVIPYYERFLSRFPTVSSLADASEDAVLAAWSGLGYYRRARLLHRGAREVREQHNGSVPRDPAQRLALPGVGRYTAGAIGSIAFELPEPIVDGNVARVLSRYFAFEAPLGDKAAEKPLWSAAEALAQGARPGALNQALMELGALVCTPLKPACARCPLHKHCQARAMGRELELPRVLGKRAPKQVAWVALVPQRSDGAYYLARGQEALFGGLWSVPHSEGKGLKDAARLQEELGLEGTLAKRPRRLRHILTHRALSIEAYGVSDARPGKHKALKAVREEELAQLGISTLTRKLLGLVAHKRS